MSHKWSVSDAETNHFWDNPCPKWDNPALRSGGGGQPSARPSTSSSHASSNARWCHAL